MASTQNNWMKASKAFSIVISFLLVISQVSFAQPLKIADLYERAELDIHTGWIPPDVETLISSPDIIVKGKFGRLLSHELWWGYSDTRESMQERLGENAHLVDIFGLPSSLYGVIIEEVLVGDIEVGTVVYRLLESDPGDRRYTRESDEKLFFLTLNPDGTYGRLGIPYILTNRNGMYIYEYPSESVPGRVDSGTLEFAPSMMADEFEEYLRNEIQRIRPSK